MRPAATMTSLVVAALLLCPALTSAQGWAPDREGGEVFVVEQRPAELRHEFSFGAAVLPLDAFYTGYAATAGYTFHPFRTVGWEVISGFLSQNVDSGLEDELLKEFQAVPTRYEKSQWGLLSQLVFKPLFGKWAWLNGRVLPVETFLTLGGGLTKYTLSYRGTLAVGLGLRVHASENVSLRLDIRELVSSGQGTGVDQVLMVGLAGSFNYGRQED